LKIILFLKCRRKKCGPNFNELLKFLPKKLSLSSQKYGLGSGIRKKPIPDSGVKKAPDPGSGSATLKGTPTKRPVSERPVSKHSVYITSGLNNNVRFSKLPVSIFKFAKLYQQ
jgi:hypothetical protein